MSSSSTRKRTTGTSDRDRKQQPGDRRVSPLQAGPGGKRLLAVTAHPDDETFGCGGTLARHAAEGVQVTLVCATRGEAGEISDPSLATRENLAQVREQELRNACDALGVSDLHLLGYRDSGMAGTPENQHPEALAQADRGRLVASVVEIIRKFRPQVVITFDPTGGYGHPDHIAIHEATLEAFAASGDRDRFSEQLGDGLAPHQPSKLYYFVFARSMARALHDSIVEAGVESDFANMDPESMGVPDDEITTVLDVGSYSDQKDQAARCHRTQIQGEDALSWLPPKVRARFLSTEYLVRAEPSFTLGQDPTENELFGGVEL